jgi:hypothetical protein
VPAHRPAARALAAGAVLSSALLAVALAPASAFASKPSVTRYSLSVTEGVSTQPEDSILGTSAQVNIHGRQIRLSIVRNGAIVEQKKGEEGVGFSQVPQVGDVVTVESPLGTTVGSVVYDGLPSMDPTVCAGSTNFSGQRSGGMTVEGSYYTVVPHTNPYYTSYEHKNGGLAQVTLLTGSTFGGSFLKPLEVGETVKAVESLETPLEGGAVFTYESETDRPVGACPAPPPPPAPPAPPALQGAILHFLKGSIHALLKSGLSDVVGINQPGTVVQDLYLPNGTLPAQASAHHRHKRPPATLIARGSATAKVAGSVTVVLHVVKRQRGRLRHMHTLHGVLITTLHSKSGATINLGRRTVTLHH